MSHTHCLWCNHSETPTNPLEGPFCASPQNCRTNYEQRRNDVYELGVVAHTAIYCENERSASRKRRIQEIASRARRAHALTHPCCA